MPRTRHSRVGGEVQRAKYKCDTPPRARAANAATPERARATEAEADVETPSLEVANLLHIIAIVDDRAIKHVSQIFQKSAALGKWRFFTHATHVIADTLPHKLRCGLRSAVVGEERSAR